jgi:hypothetical protein
MPCHIRVVRRIAPLFLAAALLFAAYWAIRLAWADHLSREGTPESISRAVNLVPNNAEYRSRRAGLPGRLAMKDLEAAVALNPMDAKAWMDLGLQAEIAGDLSRAERCLLQAARVDKGYAPRWTLANYYFRLQDEPNFWRWARQAAEMSYITPTALYRLCWRMTTDPDTILRKAIPDQPARLAQYLSFLLAENRLGAATPVAERILPHDGEKDSALLLACSDRLLAAGDVSGSLLVWNSMIRAGLLPYSPLDPAHGASLTNGGFTAPPTSVGFDWRIHSFPGVEITPSASPPALRITFSGRQPESCEILHQFVPLLPDRRYLVRFLYETSTSQTDTGLRWRIIGRAKAAKIAEAPLGESLAFETPPGVTLVRLALSYQRPLGSTRFEGWLALRKVAVELR